MDSEVGRTLAELERKLHELERALSAERECPEPGGQSAPPQPPPQSAPPQSAPPQSAPPQSAPPQSAPPQSAPPQSAPQPPPPVQATGARLVDEELSERLSPFPPAPEAPSLPGAPTPPSSLAPGASPPAPGASPLAPGASPLAPGAPSLAPGAPLPRPSGTREAIELSELVRFRDKLTRTVRELVDDYNAIITLRKADPGSVAQRDSGDDAPQGQTAEREDWRAADEPPSRLT